MITIKSSREIELMKTAGDILARTREHLIPYIKLMRGNTWRDIWY